MKSPWRIVKRGKRRESSDGRYIVFARFGLLWVARRPCACERYCLCNIPCVRLKGGVSGEAFETLRGLQAALKHHYLKKLRKRSRR